MKNKRLKTTSELRAHTLRLGNKAGPTLKFPLNIFAFCHHFWVLVFLLLVAESAIVPLDSYCPHTRVYKNLCML